MRIFVLTDLYIVRLEFIIAYKYQMLFCSLYLLSPPFQSTSGYISTSCNSTHHHALLELRMTKPPCFLHVMLNNWPHYSRCQRIPRLSGHTAYIETLRLQCTSVEKVITWTKQDQKQNMVLSIAHNIQFLWFGTFENTAGQAGTYSYSESFEPSRLYSSRIDSSHFHCHIINYKMQIRVYQWNVYSPPSSLTWTSHAVHAVIISRGRFEAIMKRAFPGIKQHHFEAQDEPLWTQALQTLSWNSCKTFPPMTLSAGISSVNGSFCQYIPLAFSETYYKFSFFGNDSIIKNIPDCLLDGKSWNAWNTVCQAQILRSLSVWLDNAKQNTEFALSLVLFAQIGFIIDNQRYDEKVSRFGRCRIQQWPFHGEEQSP